MAKSSATFTRGKNCVFSGVRLDSAMSLPDVVWTNPNQVTNFFPQVN